MTTLKQYNPRIHWEAARSVVNSVRYCSDADKRAPNGRIWSSGFHIPGDALHILDAVDLYEWQRQLVAELREDPDERRILWYYDQEGGSGKTALAKHILTNLPRSMFFSGGKFADMAYQVIRSKFDPRVIVLNLPRTADGKVSYSAIESMKDGLLQSGKYEGGWRMFPPPHLVVFANFMPDLASLSLDRWEIRELAERRLR